MRTHRRRRRTPACGVQGTRITSLLVVVLVALCAGLGMLLRGAAAGVAAALLAAAALALLAAVVLVAHRTGTACLFRREFVGIARSVGRFAAFPRVVSREQYPAAVAQSGIAEHTALLVGPPLGGFLYQAAGGFLALLLVLFVAWLLNKNLVRAEQD